MSMFGTSGKSTTNIFETDSTELNNIKLVFDGSNNNLIINRDDNTELNRVDLFNITNNKNEIDDLHKKYLHLYNSHVSLQNKFINLSNYVKILSSTYKIMYNDPINNESYEFNYLG